jgi:hypothetical protein
VNHCVWRFIQPMAPITAADIFLRQIRGNGMPLPALR